MYKTGFDAEYKTMMAVPYCTDLQGGLHFVDGDGPMDASVMFIGEAPGKKEDELKKPFLGAAGKLLSELLESIGMKRDEVYITNIVKCRPPDNRDPDKSEISAGLPYLAKEIEGIKPKLIVFLGRHSLNAFFPDKKIGLVHGNPFIYNEQAYLPVYHPAAGLYRGEMKKDLVEDFKIIPQILKKLNNIKELIELE